MSYDLAKLDELRRLWAVGKWAAEGGDVRYDGRGDAQEGDQLGYVFARCQDRPVAEYIAALHNAYPTLRRDLDAALSREAELRASLQELCIEGWHDPDCASDSFTRSCDCGMAAKYAAARKALNAPASTLVADLRSRVTELETALSAAMEYARHDEGCSAPFGYGCRCGWERVQGEVKAAIAAKGESNAK